MLIDWEIYGSNIRWYIGCGWCRQPARPAKTFVRYEAQYSIWHNFFCRIILKVSEKLAREWLLCNQSNISPLEKVIIRVISRALKELCAQFTSGEKYCQIELVWNWDLKKGRWGSCIANLEELIHRGIVHCSSGWGGQDRDHNIPVQILKIDNTMTLSLSY